MNDVISKRILNASQKPGPLRLCHAAPDYNALTVSQLKTHTVICDSNSGDATDCSMNLVVELKVNAAKFWVLLVNLTTE